MRPGPAEQGHCPLLIGDAAADAQDHVVDVPDRGVVAQEQLIEPIPGVVTTCSAALQVQKEGVFGHGCGDAQHGLHLGVGARFERVVPHAEAVEFMEQGDSLVDLRDARGDGDAANRSAVAAGGLDQLLAAQVEVPQVAI